MESKQVVKLWTKLVETLQREETIVMRIIIIGIFMFMFFFAVTHGTGGELHDLGRTSQDATRPDRINILNKDGDIIWYIEMDRLNKNRAIIYNEKGKERGVIQPDPIRPPQNIILFRRFND